MIKTSQCLASNLVDTFAKFTVQPAAPAKGKYEGAFFVVGQPQELKHEFFAKKGFGPLFVHNKHF